MSNRLAVCLLTCDRPDLTAITADSFMRYNADQRHQLALLHCDGGSVTTENCEIAARYGFRTLAAPNPANRIGQIATLRHFLHEVRALGLTHLVWLENDWESVAPLPSPAWVQAQDAVTIRLFGDMKARSGPRAPAGRHRIGTHEKIAWAPAGEGWERGVAHWGAGGTIVRTDYLAENAWRPRLKDIITADNRLPSLRPTQNVMWSIGAETTQGFIG